VRKKKNDANAIAKTATVRWMSSGGIANQPWISASTSRPYPIQNPPNVPAKAATNDWPAAAAQMVDTSRKAPVQPRMMASGAPTAAWPT
jgi:hypothetical protein